MDPSLGVFDFYGSGRQNEWQENREQGRFVLMDPRPIKREHRIFRKQMHARVPKYIRNQFWSSRMELDSDKTGREHKRIKKQMHARVPVPHYLSTIPAFKMPMLL